MLPLIVLLGTFGITLLITRFTGHTDYRLAGRVGMAAMLLLTAMGHVMYTKGMTMMIPPFLPLRKEAVYLTGMLEAVAAVCLLIPGWQSVTGWLLIVFFVLMLPANVYAAVHHINYQTAAYDGPGLRYLWFRVPEQLFFIGWVYFFAVR